MIKNVHKSSCKVPVIRVRFFNNSCIFTTDFEKSSNVEFRQSIQWEPSCSMRADGRTHKHDKANSCFSLFCECAKKKWSILFCALLLLLVLQV